MPKIQYLGAPDRSVRSYEVKNRALARRAAAEGTVILRNENELLPIPVTKPIALYGAGVMEPVCCGGGSGMVNSREFVTPWDGLRAAGYTIANADEVLQSKAELDEAEKSYRERFLAHFDADKADLPTKKKFHRAFRAVPYIEPPYREPGKCNTDTAVYILTRSGGEGTDRYYAPGDYLLTEQERQTLDALCRLYAHVVVVINGHGPMQLEPLNEHPEVEAILFTGIPGMEAGNALADVLSGKVDSTGRLTTTWARSYAEYPSSAGFGHNKDDLSREVYSEGLLVGYRFFDTFEIPVRYGFGWGLSYTSFSMGAEGLTITGRGSQDPFVELTVTVCNAGKRAGRESVQVYVSCPQGKHPKEYRRLAGFASTKVLESGESERLTVCFPLYALASYDMDRPGWVLDSGVYGLMLGNSLQSAVPCASLSLDEDVWMSETQHLLQSGESVAELKAPERLIKPRREKLLAAMVGLPEEKLCQADVALKTFDYSVDPDQPSDRALALANQLTLEQQISFIHGMVTSASVEIVGSSGMYVPGSGGQTSNAGTALGLTSLVMADGPAGLRLQKEYQLLNGELQPIPFERKFAGGRFDRSGTIPGDTYYQFATAFPGETVLAQSWNTELLRDVGEAVALEMRTFGVDIWLAPALNLHRNPLCGRNYEYYAEDPVVSARMAIAEIRGVQEQESKYALIKHFALNNSEDNRMHSDSVVTERTARELYLRAFEYAVRYLPELRMVMSSYNLINGVHAANNEELLTKLLRCEWGFHGFVMTDWHTTQQGDDCTCAGCVLAGNDLTMPGFASDGETVRKALADGSLSPERLRFVAARVIDFVLQTGRPVRKWEVTQ